MEQLPYPVPLPRTEALGHEQNLLIRLLLAHAIDKVGGVGVDLPSSMSRAPRSQIAGSLTMVPGNGLDYVLRLS